MLDCLELNFAAILQRAADLFPNRIALISNEIKTTYAKFYANVETIAAELVRMGISAHDFVIITACNCPEILEVYYACSRIGAIPISLNFRGDANDHVHIATQAQAKIVITDRQLAGLEQFQLMTIADIKAIKDSKTSFAPLAHRPTGADRFALTTGGTTGSPKIILWRQENFITAIYRGINEAYQGDAISGAELQRRAAAAPENICIVCGPIVHGAGLLWSSNCIFAGATIVLSEQEQFDPDAVWTLVERFRATVIVIVGDAMGRPLVKSLAEGSEKKNLTALRFIKSSGARLSLDVQSEFLQYFPDVNFAEYIGASEIGTIGFHQVDRSTLHHKVKQHVVINPAPGVALLDTDGYKLIARSSDKIGLIAKTGYIAEGYHNDPEKTDKTYVTVQDQRWGLSGDLGSYVEDGAIAFAGRADSCINTGGEKVFPREVEQHLLTHPSVADAIVTGVPDLRWGTAVLAVIQPAKLGRELTLTEIKSHCRGVLASYKHPKKILNVTTIARLPNGKLDRNWLAQVIASFSSHEQIAG